ncbi:transglutaminase domain-containing protein [Leucobacter ruminantium]|uniref:Transglutaminase-like superfamily protein n=1 Tax=Leucobacter ruminantium TaxID=1289170 RepID=A0A939LVY9_9MICO|nr:hypothetical protein [Leucobacter ruminantium]
MRAGVRLAGGIAAAAVALAIGVLAAWPIYRTGWLWLVALVALVLGAGLAWARERWRLSFPVFAALVLGVFALTVVPVAVPQSIASGPLRGLGDGLAAIALGWKQLLTLTLPVGTYQTVLVPAYVVMFATALLVVFIALRGGRWPVLAALPMLAPVAFGTVFGASAVSAPLHLGPVSIAAPREIGLWLAAAVLAAVWIVWTAGAERRAALRLGRTEGEPQLRKGGVVRAAVGAGILVAALAAGLLFAPMLDAGARAVPRDSIDPELVVRDRPSPLASYRNAKRDAGIDSPLFGVSADGALPERLRLAVLDEYDGVDFHVSGDAAGRFTRFPSGDRASKPSRVSVEVREGYSDIWAPTAPLAEPPVFSGPRASELSDSFYVNRETGGAIAVPGEKGAVRGLADGDAYTAEMETAVPEGELGDPSSTAPLVELDELPELAKWIDRQGLAADADGLAGLIGMLRERGYLSHSMSDREGERLWIERLGEEYGTKFESSAGGHSLARIETLFSQLNSQQLAAGPEANAAQLVAGIGDDEQFAAAAALVARALGYDSRVVVGVRLGGEEVPGVPACEDECTGENLAAWIEVRGDRATWVPFDVTPQVTQPPQRLEQGEQLPEFPTTPEERDAQEVDPPVGLGDQTEGSKDDPEVVAAPWLGPLLRIAGLSLGSAALLALPFLFLPLAKRLRSRKRRSEADPELRALGAWEELVDRARDAGVAIPEGASRAEIAEAIGSKPAVWAAAQVDRAVFSAHGIDGSIADTLWQATDADSAERKATLRRRARLGAAYSLRSYGIGFMRRHGRAEGGTA